MQRLEALERHPGAAGDKLEDSRSHLIVEAVHGAPEPAHNVRLPGAVLEARVLLPVLQVYLAQTADHQLKYRKHGESGRGKHMLEAAATLVHLLIDSPVHVIDH